MNNAPTAPTQPPPPLVVDSRPTFSRGETPCSLVDDAVQQLLPHQALVLLVPFEPVPLYTKLGNLGFSHQATQQADGTWCVEFQRIGNPTSAPLRVPPCNCPGHT